MGLVKSSIDDINEKSSFQLVYLVELTHVLSKFDGSPLSSNIDFLRHQPLQPSQNHHFSFFFHLLKKTPLRKPSTIRKVCKQHLKRKRRIKLLKIIKSKSIFISNNELNNQVMCTQRGRSNYETQSKTWLVPCRVERVPLCLHIICGILVTPSPSLLPNHQQLKPFNKIQPP